MSNEGEMMGKAARYANREMRREQAESEMTDEEATEFIAQRYDERRARGRGNRCSDETRLKLANWMVDREEAGVELWEGYYAQPEQVAVAEQVRAERRRRTDRATLDESSLVAVDGEIRRLEDVRRALVRDRRANGASWQSLADELEIERMAAVRKYG